MCDLPATEVLIPWKWLKRSVKGTISLLHGYLAQSHFDIIRTALTTIDIKHTHTRAVIYPFSVSYSPTFMVSSISLLRMPGAICLRVEFGFPGTG
jgi:hypothetical protein